MTIPLDYSKIDCELLLCSEKIWMDADFVETVRQMNFCQKVLIVTTNLDGFSLANH